MTKEEKEMTHIRIYKYTRTRINNLAKILNMNVHDLIDEMLDYYSITVMKDNEMVKKEALANWLRKHKRDLALAMVFVEGMDER